MEISLSLDTESFRPGRVRAIGGSPDRSAGYQVCLLRTNRPEAEEGRMADANVALSPVLFRGRTDAVRAAWAAPSVCFH